MNLPSTIKEHARGFVATEMHIKVQAALSLFSLGADDPMPSREQARVLSLHFILVTCFQDGCFFIVPR